MLGNSTGDLTHVKNKCKSFFMSTYLEFSVLLSQSNDLGLLSFPPKPWYEGFFHPKIPKEFTLIFLA